MLAENLTIGTSRSDGHARHSFGGNRRFLVGLTLAIAGQCLFWFGYDWFLYWQAHPLSEPVSESNPHFQSHEFFVRTTDRYNVWLDVDLAHAPNINCRVYTLLGSNVAGEPCTGTVPSLGSVTWTITRAGNLVAKGGGPLDSGIVGRAQDGYPHASIDFINGSKSFPLAQGFHYVLQADVALVPGAVTAYHPTINVAIAFIDAKEFMPRAAMMWLLEAILTITGLFLVATSDTITRMRF